MRRVTFASFGIFILFLFCSQGLCLQQKAAIISDSSTHYRIAESKDLPAAIVRDYCNKNHSIKKNVALKALFDSLGFFNARFIAGGKDTVVVDAGKRTIVDSIRISSALPLIIDSVYKVKLPRPYDQGEIRMLAKKTVYAFGSRGYPFASLSIALGDPRPGRGMTVVFSIRDNGRYAFSKPLFIGPIKTSRSLLSHDILFREAEPFDVRKVDLSRQRLLLRPYITAVDVAPPEVVLDAVLTPTTQQSLDKVLVPFVCQDAYGLGFDGAITFQAGGQSAVAGGFFGIVNISLLNLLHSGESAEVSYNGQKDYNKLAFSLAKPYLFDVPVLASGDFGLEIQGGVNGFLHGSVEGLTTLSGLWQFGLSLNGHEVWDTAGAASNYGGVDIILQHLQGKLQAGVFSQGLLVRTGSGLAHNNDRQFDRWHVDVSGGVHVPITTRQAIAVRGVGQSLFTEPDDSLQTVELYRTGGYRSIRGYADNEFAFKTVLYAQAEYLVYFSSEGSVYGFVDAGAGFGPHDQLNPANATRMLSYGVGLRMPVKIGTASIEYARNYQDTRSLGRIHVSIQNAIAAALGK